MSERSWLRRRWKLVLNLVTLGALAVLIYAIRHELKATFDNLWHVHIWALLLLIPIEAINYHAQARLYQRLFAIVGNKLDYKYLFRASLELNFVNHVFPSGGITGLSYFSLRMREGEKLTGAKATLVHFTKLMLMFLSFEIVLILGLLALSVMGRVNNLIVLTASSLSTLLVVGTGGFFFLMEGKGRINGFFRAVTVSLNRLIHLVRPKHPETISLDRAHRVIEDFQANYQAIKKSYGRLKAPFGWSLVANITEVLAVYVVFIAYGHWVNIGAVILAYAIANFAGMISVLPGGIGIYEALMATVLAATGVPAGLSLPVIITYRLLNTLIQIPPGYYLYLQALRSGQAETGTVPEPVPVELSVSQFVALLNQTLEYAYSGVIISGELANFRVSKNRWVYFDLKDDEATVKFFGSVYQLPGPLEDGMLLKVRGTPRLHNLYGFSVNVASIQPAGEGSIRRAADLLKAKLQTEGLFDEVRKRPLPYPPSRIGLITSTQSAAYADFIKVINARWQGLNIEVIAVQVQGEVAPGQIKAAIEQFNAEAVPPEVLVLIRGGGSAEDLAAFSTEPVTRAVAASRVPTLVAIGHEVDLSLAELAADRRASTPSNAAELLVPDRRAVLAGLPEVGLRLEESLMRQFSSARATLKLQSATLVEAMDSRLSRAKDGLGNYLPLLNALNPQAILGRGYAIVRAGGKVVSSAKLLQAGGIVDIRLAEGGFDATVGKISRKKR